MHFIVTGGAGFIGSHLTEQLLIEGYDSTSTEKILKDPG
ncbi:MAG: GDP-mannose 4,6-dehydratase [Scytonema hyalinum WJT4-NPBG1]|jgi:UDP-glucose 4-epimerase|nr:GDP-mannose 4,6-dehydratase [Scytonema hyalinum WJT4-NPBG1]